MLQGEPVHFSRFEAFSQGFNLCIRLSMTAPFPRIKYFIANNYNKGTAKGQEKDSFFHKKQLFSFMYAQV